MTNDNHTREERLVDATLAIYAALNDLNAPDRLLEDLTRPITPLPATKAISPLQLCIAP